MGIVFKKKKRGTFKRIVKIPADKLAEFEAIAKDKGWLVDGLSKDVAVLKSVPKRDYTPLEMDEINKLILAESKKYRHATFQY